MSLDRLKGWFAACVSKAVESLPYAGQYRYSVVSCNFAAQTLELRALESGQPDHKSVRMCTPGLKIDVRPGSEVLVGYASLSPARPFVAVFPSDPAAILKVEFMGETTPIALKGMEITCTIAQISTAAFANGAGPVTATNPLKGTITGGSTKLFGS